MECAESYVNLESTGVVELDTAVVPDVLGLRAHYEDAKSTRVLPGRARNSVQILVPNTNATPRGFHDITLVDMTGCVRSDSLNGGGEQPATTVAHISVDGYDTTTDQPGLDAAGVQAPVSRSSTREMLVLWVLVLSVSWCSH